MKAYKGFNKDMTCRGFQYEPGKSYFVLLDGEEVAEKTRLTDAKEYAEELIREVRL